MGGLARAHMAGLLQGCEMTEVDLTIFAAPYRCNFLSLFFFLPSALPFPSFLPLSLFYKYLLSLYYVPGPVRGSVVIIMNQTVYSILTTEWRDGHESRCTNECMCVTTQCVIVLIASVRRALPMYYVLYEHFS